MSGIPERLKTIDDKLKQAVLSNNLEEVEKCILEGALYYDEDPSTYDYDEDPPYLNAIHHMKSSKNEDIKNLIWSMVRLEAIYLDMSKKNQLYAYKNTPYWANIEQGHKLFQEYIEENQHYHQLIIERYEYDLEKQGVPREESEHFKNIAALVADKEKDLKRPQGQLEIYDLVRYHQSFLYRFIVRPAEKLLAALFGTKIFDPSDYKKKHNHANASPRASAPPYEEALKQDGKNSPPPHMKRL